MSRSGEECVVSALSGWFLNYSDEEWKEETNKYFLYHVKIVTPRLVHSIDFYEEAVKNSNSSIKALEIFKI